jgi:hypothetical protein
MDPLLTLEIAKTLFAGISAASAAVQAWFKSKEQRTAAATFRHTYQSVLTSPEAHAAAQELVLIMPAEALAKLEKRAASCWTRYDEVLNDDEFLPGEIDKASVAVQACVCRELNRIRVLNGMIPPRWEPQWALYDCEGKTKAKAHVQAYAPAGGQHA